MVRKAVISKKSDAGAKKNTRRALIDAAHTLIWASSYAHVSVEHICRAAGVQKGSFYHFFPTKHDLTAAALEEHWLECKPQLDAIFEENKTARTQLTALCQAIYAEQEAGFARTGTVCGCPYATLAAEFSMLSGKLHAQSLALCEYFESYFLRLLKQAVAEGLVPLRGLRARATELHVYVIGAMFYARITNSLDPVGPALEAALLRISGLEKARSR